MLDEFRSTSITWDKATRRIYSPVTANASDSNGRKLNIQVVNSGQVENLTGATLHLYWETKDKAHDGLDAFDASDISKGEFELFYTTGMLSNVGELNATLVLVDSTGKVVSDWFKITVTRGINEGAIESENSFSSLTQALIDISNLEQNYAPRLNDLTAQLQQITTNVKSFGAKGDGSTDDTVSIQNAIDYCASLGGGTVLVPIGHYIISNVNNDRWGITIPSNVMLEGAGYGSYIEVKPTMVLAGTLYHAIMFGTRTLATKGSGVRKIRLKGNQTALGGTMTTSITKYIQGIASRLDGALLESCDHITIEKNYIEDTCIPIGSCKDTGIEHSTQARLDAQHKNWTVKDNVIRLCQNKGIELQETKDSLIEGNKLYDVWDGVQVINSTRDVEINSNIVYYLATGYNFTHNVKNIGGTGNKATCVSAEHGRAAITFRTESYADNSVIENITFSGGNFSDKVTSAKQVLIFESRPTNLSVQYKDINLSDNIFNGRVVMYDITFRKKSTIKDVHFSGNIFKDRVLTVANVTENVNASENVTEITFKANTFMAAHTQLAEEWLFQGNFFKASVGLDPTSKNNVFIGNKIKSSVVDNGTSNAIDRSLNNISGTQQVIETGNLISNASNPTPVAFPKPFSVVPKVVVSPILGGANREAVIQNITTTGFDLYTFNAGAPVALMVDWIAVGNR